MPHYKHLHHDHHDHQDHLDHHDHQDHRDHLDHHIFSCILVGKQGLNWAVTHWVNGPFLTHNVFHHHHHRHHHDPYKPHNVFHHRRHHQHQDHRLYRHHRSRAFILSVVFCVFIFLTVPRAKSVFMYLYIPEFVFKFVLETVEFLPTERRLK